MPNEKVTARTCDGDYPCHVMTPVSGGPWPAVIFYMDAGGIRLALFGMAQRLADNGYVVLMPDLFYRYGSLRTDTVKTPSSAGKIGFKRFNRQLQTL